MLRRALIFLLSRILDFFLALLSLPSLFSYKHGNVELISVYVIKTALFAYYVDSSRLIIFQFRNLKWQDRSSAQCWPLSNLPLCDPLLLLFVDRFLRPKPRITSFFSPQSESESESLMVRLLPSWGKSSSARVRFDGFPSRLPHIPNKAMKV